MKVEYTNRALADLRKASADSRAFGDRVAEAFEQRIREVIAFIQERPEGAAKIVERPGVRVKPLVPYPHKTFSRILEDRVRILHIRHTSRRSWTKYR
jgi:toxin ParE1/3/4